VLAGVLVGVVVAHFGAWEELREGVVYSNIWVVEMVGSE
jgi:hypothetical protein